MVLKGCSSPKYHAPLLLHSYPLFINSRGHLLCSPPQGQEGTGARCPHQHVGLWGGREIRSKLRGKPRPGGQRSESGFIPCGSNHYPEMAILGHSSGNQARLGTTTGCLSFPLCNPSQILIRQAALNCHNSTSSTQIEKILLLGCKNREMFFNGPIKNHLPAHRKLAGQGQMILFFFYFLSFSKAETTISG